MMKLSEAIRLGALIRPQAFGKFFDGIGSCAGGAAAEAMGIRIDEVPEQEIDAFFGVTRFDVILEGVLYCPSGRDRCPEITDLGEGVVVHLNDYHRWTREAIADWVEGLEHQAELQVAKEVAVTVAA